MPPSHAAALDSEREVRDEADRLAGTGRVGHRPAAVDEVPLGCSPAVVEDGLAHELDLHRPLDALDRADEHVVAVVVGRRSSVRRDLVFARAGPHRQRVADGDPAPRRLPERDKHVRPRLVLAVGRMVDPERAEPERPGLTVEEAPEDARGVERRDAEPVDRAVRSHERAGVAVRKEGVLGDRWEGGRRGGALGRGPASVAALLTTRPTGRASDRARQPARPLLSAPMIPVRTDARAEASRAAAA